MVKVIVIVLTLALVCVTIDGNRPRRAQYARLISSPAYFSRPSVIAARRYVSAPINTRPVNSNSRSLRAYPRCQSWYYCGQL